MKYFIAAVALTSIASLASAETTIVTYDAKGRVVQVVRSNGVVTSYTYDKADNRKRVVTTGAPNP